jgi:hypothetical protein
MKKQVGKYQHDICDKCGYDITEHWDRGFSYNELLLCRKCWDELSLLKPFFISEIPTYVDGGTYHIFDFENEHDLYRQLVGKRKLSNGEILVKDDGYGNMIATQNIQKKHWWVLGYVCNFNMNKLNIPVINYYIYDNDGLAIQKDVAAMIKGKIIVNKNYQS